MSFILDALKKSEAERKRQDAPGIASIPESRQRQGAAKWIWIIGGLLLVNLAVLVGLMLRPDDAPPVTSAAARPEATSEKPPPETFSEIVREAKRNAPEVVQVTGSGEPPQAGEAPQSRAAAAEPAPSAAEVLPTFNELRADGILQLPDLHLDIHVYSGQAADRFVFVNMSKYKEGSTLSEGPVVREIAPDGVILDYRGRRFLLPRE